MAQDNPPITGSAQRRVAAPMNAVWAELGLTRTFLETLPLDEVNIDPDQKSAFFIARFGIGPVKFSRAGTGSLVERKPPERMIFELSLDDGSMHSLHTVMLSAGAEDETILNYEAELQPAHPMPRLRRFLGSIFELHVRDFADRLSASAARHWKAEQAFGLDSSKTP